MHMLSLESCGLLLLPPPFPSACTCLICDNDAAIRACRHHAHDWHAIHLHVPREGRISDLRGCCGASECKRKGKGPLLDGGVGSGATLSSRPHESLLGEPTQGPRSTNSKCHCCTLAIIGSAANEWAHTAALAVAAVPQRANASR